MCDKMLAFKLTSFSEILINKSNVSTINLKVNKSQVQNGIVVR